MEVKKQDKESNDELRRLQLIATRELIKPSAGVKIGTLDVEAWKQTETIMLNEKQIKQPVRVEAILKQ